MYREIIKSLKSLSVLILILLLSLNLTTIQQNETDLHLQSAETIDDQESVLVPSWRTKVSSDPTVTPVPILGPDGNIFVYEIGYHPKIYSLDENGSVRWEFGQITKGYSVSKPVFGKEGGFYILSHKGGETTSKICAIDSSGNLSWSQEITNCIFNTEEPMLVKGDGIYIGSSDGYLYKYGLNGEKKFEKKLFDNRLIVLGEIDDHLYLLESGQDRNRLLKTDLDGGMIWDVDLGTEYKVFDFIVDDAVYLALEEEVIFGKHMIKAFEVDGDLRWSRIIGYSENVIYSFNSKKDSLYFITKRINTTEPTSNITSLDYDDGEIRWNFTFQHDSPAVWLGYINFYDTDYIYTSLSSISINTITDIYSFEQDGTLRYNMSTEDKSILRFGVSSKEVFYAGTDDGNITAFSLDKSLPEAEAGENRTVEPDEMFTLNASGSWDDTKIVNYTWQIEDKYHHGPVVEHSFPKEGTYRVNLTVEDGAGRIDHDSIIIEVETKDTPGVIFPTFMIAAVIATLFTLKKRQN